MIIIQQARKQLPFKNEAFHFFSIMVTICSVDDLPHFSKEARALKKRHVNSGKQKF